MICENFRKLRLELASRQENHLCTKINAEEVELIKLHIQSTKTNSKYFFP